MIFFSVAFKFGASADLSRAHRPRTTSPRVSASCSNNKSWDAIFGPVTISAAGILEGCSAGATRTKDATASRVLRFEFLKTFYKTAVVNLQNLKKKGGETKE